MATKRKFNPRNIGAPTEREIAEKRSIPGIERFLPPSTDKKRFTAAPTAKEGGIEPELPFPRRDESANEFIRRREKIESLLSHAAGRQTPSKRDVETAVKIAAEEQAAKGEQVSVVQASQARAEEAGVLGQLERQAAEGVAQNAFNEPITIRNPQTGEITQTTRGESLVQGATAVVIIGSLAAGIASVSAGITAVGASTLKGVFAVGGATAGTGFIRSTTGRSKQQVTDSVTNYNILIELASDPSVPESQIFDMAAQIENDLDRIERTMKLLTANEITSFLSGGKDVLDDIQLMRAQLIVKRQLLAQAIALRRQGRVPEEISQ